MSDDDQPPRSKTGHIIGQPLDELSVADLDDRIVLLRREISRLEAMATAKRGALGAAMSFFTKPTED